VRRLLLVACLLVGLLSASAGSAQAMPHAKRLAKACKPAKKKKAARASAAARPTPIRVREANRRVAVKRAARKRCAKRKARHRAVAPKAPPAGAPDPALSPQPGAPSSPPAPGAPTPADPAPPTVPEPASNPFAVQVLSGEFFLRLSKPEVHAGNVRVEFNNMFAEDPHDLHVIRQDGTGASYSFGELQSGEVEAKTLKLNAGGWRLFCALPEHAERGMSAKLRVVNG
jgi:hypothetical protein